MAELLRPYAAVLGSRLRAQTAYRASFGLDVVGNVGIGLLEFAEIYVIFANIDALGGLDVTGALLVFGLANACMSLADMVTGHVDTIPTYLRAGTLDAFLLRPMPVLAQLITSDVSLKRLGRSAIAAVVLVYVLPTAVEHWTLAKVALLATTIVAGSAIFAAIFVWVAAAQFWLVQGGEFGNAFTYGGSYVASYPLSIFHVLLRTFFTFVVPAAFTAYLPALVLLGEPGPPGLPAWLGWFTPVAALVAWAAALLFWRSGLRHYTGAGG